MSEELKPCPFCGSEVEISTYRNEGYQIECPNHEWTEREMWLGKRPESDIAADVGMFTWGISDEAKAALIEAWNTRTPEQAIAVTLGGGKLTAEQVMAIAGRHQPDYCSDTHVCFDWQEIADELNAALCGGECEWELEHSGTLYDKWRCSECKFLFVEPRCDQGYTDLIPNFCPNCGKAVKR